MKLGKKKIRDTKHKICTEFNLMSLNHQKNKTSYSPGTLNEQDLSIFMAARVADSVQAGREGKLWPSIFKPKFI